MDRERTGAGQYPKPSPADLEPTLADAWDAGSRLVKLGTDDKGEQLATNAVLKVNNAPFFDLTAGRQGATPDPEDLELVSERGRRPAPDHANRHSSR